MSILAHTMHRSLEPLSDVDINMVNVEAGSQSSQKKAQGSKIDVSVSSKSLSTKSNEASSSSSQNGLKSSQSKGVKRKSDALLDEENEKGSKAENIESTKKTKKRVSLINESSKEGEKSSATKKKDDKLLEKEEKRKEKEAKEEEKRKEKEAKEEEKRKEREAKEEEKRKEKEAKEEEKRKEREAKEEEKRKEKEAKEEERRKEREAKDAEKAKKDAERASKEAEKAAKEAEKAAKEAEKEAKRNKEIMQTKKAASFMSAFVQKPSSSSTSPKKQTTDNVSDFDRTFLPCTFKNRAPINRFAHAIASDFDGCIGKSELVKDQLLKSFLNESKIVTNNPATTPKRKSRKGIRAPVSVRESMRLITEAGVLGDDRLLEENGKRGLANLADRKKLPVKLLHFASDRRPAWYGTWTRSSNFVSARKPLAQDPVALDYSYDSDAEWEDFDPMEGDDLNDNDDKEDDHESRSDSDSEMDDWLVDDLEEEEDDEGEGDLEMNMFGNRKSVSPVKSLKGRNRSSLSPSKPFVNKLDVKKKPKKFKPIGRRFETKLVKFETGPHWESELGVASYEGFNAYQMEMLNDTYIGLNPFTFTSTDLSGTDTTIPTNTTVKTEQAEQTVNANVLASTSASTSPSNPNKPTGQSATLIKAKAFPEEHLKELLVSIEGSSSIRPILIEGLHSKYASEGKAAVPKTTLEACLTTYAEKQSKKAGGKWVIKAEFREMAGLQA